MFYLRNGLISRKLYLFFTCFIFIYFIGFNPFPSNGGIRDLAQNADGNLLRQICLVLLFLYFFIYLLRENRLLDYFIKNTPALLLIFLCFISFLWSLDPALTVRRSAVLFINFFIFTSFFYLNGYQRTILLLRNVFAFLLVASVVLSITYHGAVHQAADVFDESLVGSWRGVFGHKNNAAAFAVTSIVIFLLSWISNRESKWLLFSALSIVFLFMTKSKTSVYLFVPLFLLSFFLVRFFEVKWQRFLISMFFFGSLILLLFNLDEVRHFLYDNPSFLTGRAAIWYVITDIVQDNLIFGLGYGSVWGAGDWSVVSEYTSKNFAWTSMVSSAHNGYIDLFLSLGIIGFFLFIYSFIYTCMVNVTSMPSNIYSNSLLLMAFNYVIFHNIMESGFLNSDSTVWFLTLFIYSLKFCNSKGGVSNVNV